MEKRFNQMTLKQLQHECRKIADKSDNKLAAALADILLITVFQSFNSNDPYKLSQKSQTKKTFDLYNTKV